MPVSTDDNLATTIKDVLSQYPAVRVGYLFGSASRGRRGPLSDIDVAVLLHESPSGAHCEGEIRDALCRALRTDRIDMVSLIRSPAALGYRVIRDGSCIYCTDRKYKERYETETIMRYLDFKPIREQAFRTVRKRILETV